MYQNGQKVKVKVGRGWSQGTVVNVSENLVSVRVITATGERVVNRRPANVAILDSASDEAE